MQCSKIALASALAFAGCPLPAAAGEPAAMGANVPGIIVVGQRDRPVTNDRAGVFQPYSQRTVLVEAGWRL